MASAALSGFGNPSTWLASKMAATLLSTDLGTQYNGIGSTFEPVMGDTITAIGYHQGTTTGTPAVNNLSCALYPLTTGGLPNTGATFANAALGSVTPTSFQPVAANDNTWVWITLATPFTLTQGQEYGVAIWNGLGTDAANKITVNPGFSTILSMALPTLQTCAAGTWSKPSASHLPTIALQSSTNVYGLPYNTATPFVTNNTVGSTTESGFSFTVPTNFGSTYTLRGVRGLISTPATNASNTFQANLYSTPLASPTQLAKSPLIIADRFERFGNIAWLELYFTTSPQLTTGVKYGIGFSTTAANAAGVYTLDQVSQSDFDGWAYQRNTAYMSRTASSFAGINTGAATGNFAETTTKRPWLEILFDDITASSGSGGYSRSRTVYA